MCIRDRTIVELLPKKVSVSASELLGKYLSTDYKLLLSQLSESGVSSDDIPDVFGHSYKECIGSIGGRLRIFLEFNVQDEELKNSYIESSCRFGEFEQFIRFWFREAMEKYLEIPTLKSIFTDEEAELLFSLGQIQTFIETYSFIKKHEGESLPFLVNQEISNLNYFMAVSYTHLPSPRDLSTSRMPSSA